ncbi:ABC-F family ATP-binding cassette domain-containing protein [Demequina sp.]|uniref:ABC-F family ATP-binding cassette domain-containing protein n=1 Tax=Demequina sp. TaxID=2050685 RepID=UPI003D126045
MHALSLSHVSFSWPDGRPLFNDLTFALSPGLSGIVGRNGIGKSSLLRLAVGLLRPTAGHVERPARLAYVPQSVTLAVGDTVASVLGVAERLAALRAIEAGSSDAAHYEILADDWLVEDRALTVLRSLGLGTLTLDRAVGEVSGGEATLLAIGAALIAEPEVLLLDEPTNNLDAHARDLLAAALATRSGATAVVTHDRALLAAVDRIGELRERDDRTTELRWFGGALHEFEASLAAERAAAEQAVVTASADVSRQHRDLRARVEGDGKRRQRAAKAKANAEVTRGGVKAKQDQAAKTEARVSKVHEARLERAREALATARAAIPRDRSIKLDLPGTTVPQRRAVTEIRGLVTRTETPLTALIQGPERIHVTGRNGSGKTTLIETLLGAVAPVSGEFAVHVPVGYLPQRLDVLDDAASVLENVRRRAPGATPQEIRDQLGKFQFRGAAAEALAGTLSGGERFRAALASVLLARPEPQLLILDEPTNNLDFESQSQLVQALEGYGGALLVVSHDQAFVDAISPTRRWSLENGAVRDEQLS